MKLKLVIRFNHMAIETLDLSPGEYEIGRSSDCDIQINHPSIHRRHGRLAFREKNWIYQKHNSEDIEVLGESALKLSSEIEIATLESTEQEITADLTNPLALFRKKKKIKFIYGFILAGCLVAGGVVTYFALRSQLRHSDPNLLLSQVRSRIVEFEKIKDPQAIQDYKDIAKFKDEDFREVFGFCTGFLVAPGVVLTASHCLWGSDFLGIQTNFEVRTFDGKKHKPQRVLGFDLVRDYLFLEVPGMESYGFLEFANDFKIGQTVYTLGNAHGEGIAIREGIMASETADINDPSVHFIRYSAGASPGNSGGPLLDIHGRIVALVFAATGAENYNLGTSAKDLKEAYEKFVKNTNEKIIKVQAKKLFQFNPIGFLQKQMLPYFPDYNEYPDLLQKVNNIEFTFKAPMSLDEVSQKVLSEVQDKSVKAVKAMEEDLIQKKELILDWTSFVSLKTPVILTSQFDLSQNHFFLWNKHYYMKQAGFLDSPGKKDFRNYIEQFEKEKKFDFQSYGLNTDLVPPGTPSGELMYMPRDVNKTKKNIEDLAQGDLYSQFWPGKKISDPKLLENFFEKYIGEEGILSSTYTAFIRPQSFKNFIIESIKKPSDKQTVKDGSGREWQRFHVKLFEQIHIYVYCMPLPEGVVCASRAMPAEDDYRLALLEGNFREYILAHFLENPYFWRPAALSQFLQGANAKTLTSLKGFQLKEINGKYIMTLDAFKVRIELPSHVQSLRPLTGMYLVNERSGERKVEWAGFGVEWVTSSPKPQVCGVGLEPVGTQSIFILNFLRDSLKRQQLKEGPEKEEIPKLWTEKMTLAGKNFEAYGYCAPLRENPMEIGYYFADFKRAMPHKGSLTLIR